MMTYPSHGRQRIPYSPPLESCQSPTWVLLLYWRKSIRPSCQPSGPPQSDHFVDRIDEFLLSSRGFHDPLSALPGLSQDDTLVRDPSQIHGKLVPSSSTLPSLSQDDTLLREHSPIQENNHRPQAYPAEFHRVVPYQHLGT